MGSSKTMLNAEFGVGGEGCIPEELAAAWEANPRCAQCGEPVSSVLEAAWLVGSNRVTHRERCFIPALIRGNPHLKIFTARTAAQERGAQQSSPPSEASDRALGTGIAGVPEPGHG